MSKKPLSQIFLKDRNILRKILNFVDLSPHRWVLEIGSGEGDLTEAILASGVRLIAFEIDTVLYTQLKDKLKDNPNLFLYREDYLKVELNRLRERLAIKEKLLCISNIPYRITTPLLSKLMMERLYFDRIYLTLQKEVAQRITAKPGTKSYGALTLFLNYYFQTNILFFISKNSFSPVPTVNSAFVSLLPREESPVEVKDEELFFKIIRTSFRERRKKLKNSIRDILKEFDVEVEKEPFPVSLSRRGETLTLEDFALLTDYILSKKI